MIQITTASQASAASGAKMLAYGGSGSGKTVLAATLPAPIMISAESGALSLHPNNLNRLFGPNDPTVTYDMPIIEVKTVEQLTDVYNWLAGSTESHQYGSVALDSISEIGEVVLANAKSQVKDPRQAYGALIDQMENVIRLFRDLPGRHVYISAKQEPMKDELTGVIRYGPSMPGSKLGPKLPYFFDEVFRLGINQTPQGEKYRFIQTQPDIQFEAKDRSGALAPIEVPNLSAIIAKILGG